MTGLLTYDLAWESTMAEELVWEPDLKQWIGEWVKAGCLEVRGLAHRQRVPRLNSGHVLAWKSPKPTT
jgi:hypothetical protein